MDERVSRMERIFHDLSMFLNRDNQEITMTIYKKEANKLKRLIYECDIPVTIEEEKNVTAEKVTLLIKKM